MKTLKTSSVAGMLAGLAILTAPTAATASSFPPLMTAASAGTAALSNSPPTANPDSLTISCNNGTGFHATANDYDPDGDTLIVTSAESSDPRLYVSTGDGAYGIVTIGTPSSPGTYYVYYSISDGQGGSSSSFITVNVTSGGPYCS